MKNNYELWNLSLDQFTVLRTEDEIFSFFLKFAELAPSGHNAQPWSFEIHKNSIHIKFEESRLLKFADREQRQAHIGIGCSLTNLVIVSKYFGYETKISYYSTKDSPIKVNLSKTKTKAQRDKRLVSAILNRRTNRGPYKNLKKESFLIKTLKDMARTYNLDLLLTQDVATKISLAKLLNNALNETMDSIEFREELSYYVRSNITKSYIGMPLFGMGIKTLPSLFAPFVLKKINVARKSESKTIDLLVNKTPIIGVIASMEDTKKEWIKTGEYYQLLALKATSEGAVVAPFTAPIEIFKYRNELKKIYKTEKYPQMCFRFGAPTLFVPHSPRLPIARVLKRFK